MLNAALLMLCTVATLMMVYRVQNMPTLPRWLGGADDEEAEALDLQMVIVVSLIVLIAAVEY